MNRRTLSRPLLAVLLLTASASLAHGQLQEADIFKQGPLEGDLGPRASIKVPAHFLFVPTNQMPTFARLTKNPHGPGDVGAVLHEDGNWSVWFGFEESGYVKDDEKDKIDADAILKNIKEGTAASNPERVRLGGAPLNIVGWEQKPFFDPDTKNLTWAVRASSEGHEVINYESRILGRRGVMSATLIVAPDKLAQTLPAFKQLLTGYSYKSGEKYSEWREGDKVAAYGLTALIAGGAVAAAAKSGLLGKLLKPIIVGIAVLGGAIASFFRRIFGRKSEASS